MKTILLVLLGSACLAGSGMAASALAIAKLNAALKNEFNTMHNYRKHATQAEREGNAPVAKLFLAVARAEEIHRRAIRASLTSMGGVPNELSEATPRFPNLSATLTRVIANEKLESESIYPDLLKTLKNESEAADASRIIEFARKAEAQHAVLFGEALSHLGKNHPTSYFICPECSYISTEKPGKNCHGCQGDKKPLLIK